MADGAFGAQGDTTMRLWRNNGDTKEGKYLVLRKGGVVFPHPAMVLGARDPATPDAILAYADAVERLGRFGRSYVGAVGDDAFVIRRRDGTAPDWPGIVLHAADPASPDALTAYAFAASAVGMDAEYVADVRAMALEFSEYEASATQYARAFGDELTPEEEELVKDLGLDREVTEEDVRAYAGRVRRIALQFEAFRAERGVGDPDAPRHRKDDPATIALMRSGRGA